MGTKKEIIDCVYDAGLITAGLAICAFASRKLTGRGLGPLNELSGGLKHMTAIAVSVKAVEYLKENKYIPNSPGGSGGSS